MRVVVLYNQPTLPREHPEFDAEEGVCTAASDIAAILVRAGFDVRLLGVRSDLGSLERDLAAHGPHVVFNLFEGHADRPESEIAVARLLERRRLPFTGSPSKALWLSLNKHLAKRRLLQAGLAVPASLTIWALPLAHVDIPFPAIVKPARRDASEGIDQNSVVTNRAMAKQRIAMLLERYGPPVLIEEFHSGREFTVALLEAPELSPLPISEVQFNLSAAFPWPVLSYAAKWLPGTSDYEATKMQTAVPLPPTLRHDLNQMAMRAFRSIGCRDYARIDLRLSSDGQPVILEVNANPDLSPTACFAGALAAGEYDREALIANVTCQAAARANRRYTRISLTTLPLTSVNLKSRPW